jgi:hypothetical protein
MRTGFDFLFFCGMKKNKKARKRGQEEVCIMVALGGDFKCRFFLLAPQSFLPLFKPLLMVS